jgi:hypothetical protein
MFFLFSIHQWNFFADRILHPQPTRHQNTTPKISQWQNTIVECCRRWWAQEEREGLCVATWWSMVTKNQLSLLDRWPQFCRYWKDNDGSWHLRDVFHVWRVVILEETVLFSNDVYQWKEIIQVSKFYWKTVKTGPM